MRWMEVQSPGLFTTVQDLGRPGYGPIGVSASGAADATALRVANMILGNSQNAAGLEMTLQGGQFVFRERALIALGGSDFGSAVDGQAVPMWTPHEVRAGQVLTCGRSRSGARCYLCVRGGFRVPLILGSASTHVLSGLGGLEGRALRRGDRLEIGEEPGQPRRRGVRSELVPVTGGRFSVRVTEGPQCDWFTEEAVTEFYGCAYGVTSDANRMGIRLAGPAVPGKVPTELISEGVAPGSIQIPSGGQPLILFVEQQTTGGYAKIANVIAADLPVLGQLKPGDVVRFRRVDLREARELLYIQERWIASSNSYL